MTKAARKLIIYSKSGDSAMGRDVAIDRLALFMYRHMIPQAFQKSHFYKEPATVKQYFRHLAEKGFKYMEKG